MLNGQMIPAVTGRDNEFERVSQGTINAAWIKETATA